MATATRTAIHVARPSLNIIARLDDCPCNATARLDSTTLALPTPISPILMAQLAHRWPVLPLPSADDAPESYSVSSASARRPPSVLSQAESTTSPWLVSHERPLAFQHKLLDSRFISKSVYNAEEAQMVSQSASCDTSNTKMMSTQQANTECTALLPTPPTSPLDRLDANLLSTLLTPRSPLASSTTPMSTSSDSYRHGVRYGVLSSVPSARVKTPDTVKARLVDAIHGPDHGPSALFTLPNETLSHILSFVPLSSLPPLMRVCSHLHALSERILYHTLQHIQFYSPPDAAYLHPADSLDATFGIPTTPAATTSGSKDWALVYTLATRPSAARCVRHFAVRGLPWLGEDEVGLLARALSGMRTGLVSLEINLGIPVERALVCALSNLRPISANTHAEPDGFVHLSALNVLDVQTALYFLGARQNSCIISSATATLQQQHKVCVRENDRVPSSADWIGKDAGIDDGMHAIDGGLQTPSARSPLSVLRIDFQHPLEAASLDELLGALVPHSGAYSLGNERVQQLQLGVQCRSADEASAMASTIARRLPTLRLLGLHVYPCSPEEQVLDFMATSYDVVARSLQSTATGEKQAEKTWDLSTSFNDALSHLPVLHTLSLAYSLPFTMGQHKANAEALAYQSTLSSLHAHATPCGGSLNLIELQWSAWHLVPPRASASSSASRETKTTAVSRTWTAIPANSHQFIRLGWAYANASFV